MVENGDIVEFLRKKDYVMVNNNLGRGSFGKTVLLKDPFIDELFVAKKYEPEFQEGREQFYNSFLQEIKILHKLNHPNIVRVFNYYAYRSQFTGYLFMEYIEGITIDKYLADLAPWDNDTPDKIFVQLVEGFRYIEENNILHRDIREGNILIDNQGVVKIIDFGLGKFFKPTDVPKDSMSEIINRSGLDRLPNEFSLGVYDAQTDMFYLAELFNRMLKSSLCENDFSYRLILEKMMSQSKEGRYISFSQVQEAINKKDFEAFDIKPKDKNIYQGFLDPMVSMIDCYTDEKKFNNDVLVFQDRIRELLVKHCFENEIYDKGAFLRSIVVGSYRYYTNVKVEVSAISDFEKWFLSLSTDLKQLVLNNIIAKLATSIKEQFDDADIPF